MPIAIVILLRAWVHHFAREVTDAWDSEVLEPFRALYPEPA
jgi:hypothetical protein